MSSKRFLKMELYSQRELNPDTATRQIRVLSDFENGLLRPAKCDTGEPIREPFNPSDLREPVRWLSQPSAHFKFKQSKPFQIEGFIHNRKYGQMWTREKKGGPRIPIIPKFPEPRFVAHWVVWFGYKIVERKGIDILKQFLIEAFSVSGSEYGYLTLEDDQKAKNYLVAKKDGITTSQFVGTDPEFGIPGLYCINIFGPIYSEWLGLASKAVPAAIEVVQGNSTLIQYCISPEDCRSTEVADRQKSSIEILGEERFFDIAHPDRKLTRPFSRV
jgi:hypothetical protein